MWELILPVLGFLIGIVAAMTGVGGGIIMVPLLTLAYAFVPANAVGTSLAAITFTAVAATISYSRQRRIYYKAGLLLAIATVPGAVIGAFLTSVLPAATLGLIFGLFLIVVAIRISIVGFKKTKTLENEKSESGDTSERKLLANKKRVAIGLGLGFFGGLASGLLGIGGGVVLVPIMTLVLDMSIHTAVATSMLTMIVTSVSGVAQHYSLGNINFEFALLLAVGTVMGAQFGAYASKRLSGNNLRIIFSLVLVVVSVQMILKFI